MGSTQGLLAATAVGVCSVQGGYPLAVEDLGESDVVGAGLADVGVGDESVDGGGGLRLVHEFVEPGGVQVSS